jgi:hypothetical protein
MYSSQELMLTPQQWVVIVLNLTVHVIMYYYYYATAGGAKIWVCLCSPCFPPLTFQWKRYLTTMQITQFIIDLFVVFFASTLLFTYRIKADQYPLFPSYLMPSFFSASKPGNESALSCEAPLITSPTTAEKAGHLTYPVYTLEP